MLNRKFRRSPLANHWIIWALALPVAVALAVVLTAGQATAQVGARMHLFYRDPRYSGLSSMVLSD